MSHAVCTNCQQDKPDCSKTAKGILCRNCIWLLTPSKSTFDGMAKPAAVRPRYGAHPFPLDNQDLRDILTAFSGQHLRYSRKVQLYKKIKEFLGEL